MAVFHSVPVSDDRRFAERTALERPAVLRFGEQVAQIEVNDLTRDGCRITSNLELPPLAMVSIGIAGVGHTPARLVWRSEHHYGCAFERPLPTSAVIASKLDNVAQFAPTALPRAAPTTDDSSYSYRTRLAIIVSASGALWGGVIGLAAWVL